MSKIDIQKWKDDIIKNTCELIQIPSVYEESEDITKPFGKEVENALEYMLNLGKSLGFKTKNIDGYCGYIEFGEGEELVGIIGHLDVVPAGDDWKHAPFGAEIEDGKIYGRGAIDDKGPVIASLYAMKAVMDQTQPNKRVRLILGLNEENDWKCIEYYKQKEELPNISFSPDADFPCIYAEKGFLTIYLKQNYNENSDIEITNIDCNSNPINVVPKYCKIDLKINNPQIDKIELINYAQKEINDKGFNIEIIDNNEISFISHGIASHAAHPELGKNAILMLLVIINDILSKYNVEIELIQKLSELIGIQYNGENLGINYEDESGKLTLNVGNCKIENNEIQIGMNLRIPVTIDIEKIEKRFNELVDNSKSLEIANKATKKPLYIEKDNQLIKILCDTFNEITGLNENPVAIGGVTYARAFENCVSFGANMPGNKDLCHQADEFIEIDNLIFACEIYANALNKILEL